MHISSRENPRVKQIVRLSGDAAARRADGLFVCEGRVLLEEALKSDLSPRELFCLERDLPHMPRLDCETHTVSEGVLEKLCGTVSPRGPVFTLPLFERELPARGPIIAADDVRDPGNVGTIIRCADAFGAGVALLGNCADIFSPKVVRAAMGSLFRVNVRRIDCEALAAHCAANGIDIYAAALSENSVRITDVSLKNACVIIGNEARGVGERAMAISRAGVIIPMKSAQSLNAAVAAAICMWEAAR